MSHQIHDIVGTVAGLKTFKTFVSVVAAAGLGKTLMGSGPFTVFVPSDEAFAALPAGTIDDLMKPANKGTLAKILKRHVVPGRLVAKDVIGKKRASRSLLGEDLQLDGAKGIFVNGATVTSADIECSNGIVHIVDAVLMPADGGIAKAA